MSSIFYKNAFLYDIMNSVVNNKFNKKKHKLMEVPISYEGRTSLEGKKITWKDGVEAIWTILKWRFKK